VVGERVEEDATGIRGSVGLCVQGLRASGWVGTKVNDSLRAKRVITCVDLHLATAPTARIQPTQCGCESPDGAACNGCALRSEPAGLVPTRETFEA
jgi:hypothetical protein